MPAQRASTLMGLRRRRSTPARVVPAWGSPAAARRSRARRRSVPVVTLAAERLPMLRSLAERLEPRRGRHRVPRPKDRRRRERARALESEDEAAHRASQGTSVTEAETTPGRELVGRLAEAEPADAPVAEPARRAAELHNLPRQLATRRRAARPGVVTPQRLDERGRPTRDRMKRHVTARDHRTPRRTRPGDLVPRARHRRTPSRCRREPRRPRETTRARRAVPCLLGHKYVAPKIGRT